MNGQTVAKAFIPAAGRSDGGLHIGPDAELFPAPGLAGETPQQAKG